MSDIRGFIIEMLEREQKNFIKALDEVENDLFYQKPERGGHSAAWHALHVAEWQKIFISKGLVGVSQQEKFAYLGWEDRDFAKSVFGSTEVTDKDSKEIIIAFVKRVFNEAIDNLKEVSPDKLSPETKMNSPMGEISVRSWVLGQPMHIAYHRGQLKMGLMQLKSSKM